VTHTCMLYNEGACRQLVMLDWEIAWLCGRWSFPRDFFMRNPTRNPDSDA
jgi:hypothetical protein